MRNSKKITLSLILLGSTATAAYAGNTLFDITPSQTNFYLSSTGSGSVIYTVVNNSTASTTPSITPGYQSSGNNLTITANTCNVSLSPGASCTFRVLVSGSNQPDSFTLTPRVCGFNGFMCSIPRNAVTVVVTRPAVGLPTRAFEEVTDISQLKGININTLDVISAPMDVANGITGVAISPDGSHVYATQGGNSVVIMDVTSDSMLLSQTVVLSAHLQRRSPPSDMQIVITPDGSTLFVSKGSGVGFQRSKHIVPEASLFKIDLTPDNINVTEIADPEHILINPNGLVVSPDGKTLYVGSDTNYLVAMPVSANSIDSSNIIVEGSIPEDLHLGLAIDSAGNKLYVGNYSAASVSILAVNGMQAHFEKTIIDGQGCSSVSGLAVSSDGNTLYVADTLSNAVLDVSLITDDVRSQQPGISGALGLGLSPDGSKLYVTQSEGDPYTTIINTALFFSTPEQVLIGGQSSTVGQFVGP